MTSSKKIISPGSEITVCFKHPEGSGHWPAIWMLPQGFVEGQKTWPTDGENDLVEHMQNHQAFETQSTIHFGSPGNANNIYKIEGLIDYRSRNILNLNNSSEHVHDDEDIISFLENNFENLNFNKQYYINSRVFSCKATSSDFLWVSFSDFFREPGGDKEYIEISKKTEWIFINDFITCNDDSADLIRRFISFIDICYRNKMKIKFFFNNYS